MDTIEKILKKMSIEEKAKLCSGASIWTTHEITEHDIPAIMMTDGPHGLRRQAGRGDHMGLNASVPSTCFPTAAGMACSWNKELLHTVGIAIGEECQAEDVQIILGPATNIKRSPLCGRNFEYFSEDPLLSSELATMHIKGVQSQGVGTSIKHFAANNQETDRFNVDTIVDERTLREIYLASFEGAVKNAKPWTVMAAYNKINGTYCSENKRLLKDILKDEWGFEGFVVSDWYAVSERDRAIEAGLDLEMPTSFGIGKEQIISAIESGTLSIECLDDSVKRILTIIQKSQQLKKENATYSVEQHHDIAKKTAEESMVLLMNEDSLLPLKKQGKVAVIGAFAEKPRYQGAGSSRINPTRLDIPYEELKRVGGDVVFSYSKGYSLGSDELDDSLVNEAKQDAMNADVVIIFAGLPDKYDSEGSDRKHLSIPQNQNYLISEISKVQKNTVVVLTSGSAVEMPWIHEIKSLLLTYLGGQAMAQAVASILFGEVNPSGKLAETFPMSITQTPAYINFPGEKNRVEYKEGIFVGYRYYEKVNAKPLFPFGFGLSYTTFEYSDITVGANQLSDTEEVEVSCMIRNTGTRIGKEIVQLYVSEKNPKVIRPIKELKAFDKVELNPGESKKVTFKLDKRAFAYYNTTISDWHVQSGEFEILIGESSDKIHLCETIVINSTKQIPATYTLDSTLADVMHEPAASPIFKMFTERTHDNGVQENMGLEMESILNSIKLRSICAMSQGAFKMEDLEAMVYAMNNNRRG